MQVETTALPGVLIITPRVFVDPRGFFYESYNQETFRRHGIETVFVQDNHSKSVRGTLRGLHFQLPPAAQVKLVRVVRGAIWDVAVDIRRGSPTFGRWVGVELSASNYRQLYVPIGFAHGFCVLSDEAEVLYKTSHVYDPDRERGIAWNDPALGIAWPIGEPLLSARDRAAGTLADYLAETPFEYEPG
ncbi:MAG: dTDP-4-dehydrorhamnose 3,5-epimerase [Anaerolineae bacterium]